MMSIRIKALVLLTPLALMPSLHSAHLGRPICKFASHTFPTLNIVNYQKKSYKTVNQSIISQAKNLILHQEGNGTYLSDLSKSINELRNMKTRNAMIDLHGILYNTDNRSLLSQLALQKLSMIYKNVPEEMLHHIEGSASAMEMIGCDQSDKQRVRRMIYRIRDANMYDTECNISMPEPVLAIFALIRKHKEFEDRFLRQIHALKEETIENIEDQQVFQDEEFRNKDRDQATLRVLDQIDRIFGSK